MKRERIAFSLAAGLLAVVLSHPAGAVDTTGDDFDSATGYRIARYRAPLPESVAGGERIFAPDVKDLIEKRLAILLDVMAAEGGGYDPDTGAWRVTRTHDHIPNSTWLPDVGKGRIEPRLEAYFRGNLERLTGNDKSRAIIIYCQSDCWMSWNAVRRASSYGYTELYWFPEGIDGWRDWEGPLVPAEPTPVKVPLASKHP